MHGSALCSFVGGGSRRERRQLTGGLGRHCGPSYYWDRADGADEEAGEDNAAIGVHEANVLNPSA